MTHVTWKSKLCSVVRSSLYPFPGKLVAIGRVVLYYVQAAHAFSAGIESQPCTLGEAYLMHGSLLKVEYLKTLLADDKCTV